MSKDVNIDLVGDDELLRVFRELNKKVQKPLLKRIVGDASQKTLVSPLKREIPKRTTNLVNTGRNARWHPPGLGKKSITKKIGKSKKSVVYFVGPGGPVGDYKRDPFYLKWFEYGAYGKNRTLTFLNFYKRNINTTERHLEKSLRTIIGRIMKKARKKGIV
jgi:hypothetical protein